MIIIHYILLIYITISVIYIVTFSISSYFYKPLDKVNQSKKNRFAVLIPAYHEDSVIMECADSINDQNYNRCKFDIYVISDGMSESTNDILRNREINVLEVNFENSSKALSLKTISKKLSYYDYIIILDADNTVPYNYIENINSYINNTNCIALQTHRQTKNITNNISYIDSVIEEINNTIYRQGHNALNISSSLIGSGMVFEYNWFINNINKVNSSGEDKEIEELLLKQKQFIHYNKEIIFKDEKTSNRKSMTRQRRRWIATQFNLLMILISNIKCVIQDRNIDYSLKIIETLSLPKVILLGAIFLLGLLYTFISPGWSIVWWALFCMLLFSLFIAIPKSLRDRRLLRQIANMPFLFIMMFANLFRIKGAINSFIHTQHGE